MMNSQQQYTCPMHPEIIRDQPGSCPNDAEPGLGNWL